MTIKLITLIFFTFIALLSGKAYAINSYIYLPDKMIQEEIAIGSLIVDLSDEITVYNNQLNSNKQNEHSQLQHHQQQQQMQQLDSNENQHFTFLDDVKSSTENTYFLLDSVTGRVTSKRYLDRESMCMNKHCMEVCDQNQMGASHNASTSKTYGSCKMNLKVLIIPSYSIVSLNIIIQDINDNKPQFRIEFLNQSIPENVPIGFKIPIDLAYDPDIGVNTIQSYTFVQTTSLSSNTSKSSKAKTDLVKDTFELVQNLNESQLALVVKKKLDREKIAQYNITITACDGGVPSNCGQLKLVLNIIDINDHNPIFLKDLYKFSVMENMPTGTVIGKISAYDLDDGLNGKIKYSLIGYGGNSASGSNRDKLLLKSKMNSGNYFSLDSDTGTLTLNTPLDFEAEQFYTLNVEARDCGVGSLPAYATIEINVIDVNDNSPEISVSFLNSLYRNYSSNMEASNGGNVTSLNVYLTENAEPNKFIAHVSIFDRDSDDNSQIEWSVHCNGKEMSSSIQDDKDLLKINKLNSNSFTISTGARSHELFDREKLAFINVSIISRDKGKIPYTNMAFYNFTIFLLDINDNWPKFEKSFYEISINENNQINQMIYQFKAVDLDADENGLITYSIEDIDTTQIVYIESNTGILRAAKSFDREDVDTYEFSVIATDNSKELSIRKSTKVKCILKINDLNDNKPKIIYNSSALPYKEFSNKTLLVLKIDENIPIKTNLVKFNCQDLDANENAQTKYFLTSNKAILSVADNINRKIRTNDQLIPFKIAEDGRFYVSKKLDREVQDYYELNLMCYDTYRLNTSISLLIKINDINDNCPRNLNQSEELYSSGLNDKKKKVNMSKVKFINRDLLEQNEDEESLNQSLDNYSLFNESYADADIGKNGELKFELESHMDLFKLNTIVKLDQNRQIYNLKVMFKQSSITIKPKQQQESEPRARDYLNNLKLGKYVIKIKISDNGNPSCIKNEMFILYLSDDQAKTQLELITKLSARLLASKDPSLTPGSNYDLIETYVYDEDGLTENDINASDFEKESIANYESEEVISSPSVNKTIIPSNQQLNIFKSSALDSLRKNNYIILYCFLSVLTLMALFLILVAIIFYHRRNKAHKAINGKKKKTSSGDLLKVKNYREMDLNNSSSNNTHSTGSSSCTNSVNNDDSDNLRNEIEVEDEEDDDQCEINNLLEANNIISQEKNRLSTSFKSCDQSKSNDSVTSNMTYARESNNTATTTASPHSSQVDGAVLVNAGNKVSSQQSQNYARFNNTRHMTLLKPNQSRIYNTLGKPKAYDDYSNLVINNNSNKNQHINNRISRESMTFANELQINPHPHHVKFNSTTNMNLTNHQHQQHHPQSKMQNISFLTSFPQRTNGKYQQQHQQQLLIASYHQNPTSHKAPTQSILKTSTSNVLPVVTTSSSSSSSSSSAASTSTSTSLSTGTNIITPTSSEGSELVLPPSASLSVTSTSPIDSTSPTCESSSSSSSSEQDCYHTSHLHQQIQHNYQNNIKPSNLYIQNPIHYHQNDRVITTKYNNNLRQYVDNNQQQQQELDILTENSRLYYTAINNSETLAKNNRGKPQQQQQQPQIHYLRSSAV